MVKLFLFLVLEQLRIGMGYAQFNRHYIMQTITHTQLVKCSIAKKIPSSSLVILAHSFPCSSPLCDQFGNRQLVAENGLGTALITGNKSVAGHSYKNSPKQNFPLSQNAKTYRLFHKIQACLYTHVYRLYIYIYIDVFVFSYDILE